MPLKALGVLMNLRKWATPNTKKTTSAKRAKKLPTTLAPKGKENKHGVNKNSVTIDEMRR
jgi:hypothetical protein